MAPVTKYKGLCSTCCHAEECIHCKKSRVPIMFCEEFCTESGTGRNPRTDSSSPKPESADANERKDEVSEDLQGLCKTCKKRKTCKFPKVAGGVWHCEEYC